MLSAPSSMGACNELLLTSCLFPLQMKFANILSSFVMQSGLGDERESKICVIFQSANLLTTFILPIGVMFLGWHTFSSFCTSTNLSSIL